VRVLLVDGIDGAAPRHRAFNLTDDEQHLEFDVPTRLLGTTKALPVQGTSAKWGEDAVRLNVNLPGMCPAVIEIGDP
jgi:hypothetical protein